MAIPAMVLEAAKIVVTKVPEMVPKVLEGAKNARTKAGKILHHDISDEVNKKIEQKSFTVDFERLNKLAEKNLIMISPAMRVRIIAKYEDGGKFRQDKVTTEFLSLLNNPVYDFGYNSIFGAEYSLSLTLKTIERLKDKGGHMGRVLWDIHFEKLGGLFSPTPYFQQLYNRLYEGREGGVPEINLFHKMIFNKGHEILDVEERDHKKALKGPAEKAFVKYKSAPVNAIESAKGKEELDVEEYEPMRAIPFENKSCRRPGFFEGTIPSSYGNSPPVQIKISNLYLGCRPGSGN